MKRWQYTNFWASKVAQLLKNPPAKAGDAGDAGSVFGSRRSPGVRNSNPLQYSSLGYPVDRGSRHATVHGVTKSQGQEQYVSQELPGVQAGFRKGRGTKDQIDDVYWIIEKAREFQENIYLCFINYTKAFDCVDHNKLWKALKEMGIPDPSSLSPEKAFCMS